MKVYNEIFEGLWRKHFEEYKKYSKLLIQKIDEDKANISEFDTFNRRFKISRNITIRFNDELKITREDTRKCYELMLKLSDLWFAYEHLLHVCEQIIPPPQPNSNKCNKYPEEKYRLWGINDLIELGNSLFWQSLFHTSANRKWFYPYLGIMKKNTRSGTKNLLQEVHEAVKDKNKMEVRHFLVLVYGIRNIYVHQGMNATMGSEKYHLKRLLFEALHDILSLLCIQLGTVYLKEKLHQLALVNSDSNS